MNKPTPPLTRHIIEGTEGTCTCCGSTESKKYFFFGPKIGCINPECTNYKYNKQRNRKIKLQRISKKYK